MQFEIRPGDDSISTECPESGFVADRYSQIVNGLSRGRHIESLFQRLVSTPATRSSQVGERSL
ncbi:hypothetical protein IQ268_01960 [Oculatella sp. LEGE 06141]|uniref:hypothetical protein n=1 Tax=Oculatella sp. LEGE 06141 TaxID=1828648 RepID=UPI0018810D9B|nr:hypothetical protein [Oculatella sp. LEGE 06141]MBE9177338.1 hypothetical protein [Oculatella sp. LEGE 06141]